MAGERSPSGAQERARGSRRGGRRARRVGGHERKPLQGPREQQRRRGHGYGALHGQVDRRFASGRDRRARPAARRRAVRGALAACGGTPLTVPLHRVRNYEELEGAQGREVFFRPERYRAKDLVPLRSEVVITVAGSERMCPLLDLSENGAAFEWPSALVPAIGDRFGSLSVRFDSHESYRGEARVGSVREIDGATIVGISFEGRLVSIDEVLELRAIKTFIGHRAGRPAWRVAGRDRCNMLVAALRVQPEHR